jgi:threonine dehydratase
VTIQTGIVPPRRVTAAGIARAAQGIDPVFLNTPIVTHRDLDAWLGAQVAAKVECLAPIRSFKGRGGDWFIKQRNSRAPVVAASAGNFGQALAAAASTAGVECTIFASVNANPLKVSCMRLLGAKIMRHGDDFDAAKAAARDYARARDVEYVEDGRELAITEGAGTIAIELANATTLDTLLVPLGNGALLAGVATWMRAVAPRTKVIGVVAAGAPCMQHALEGREVRADAPLHTIADGIAVRVPVPEAVADLHGMIDGCVSVDDETIKNAMRGLLSHVGLLVEPAGAAGIAALLAAEPGAFGPRVGTILCGGNVTREQMLEWELQRAPSPR